MKRILTALALLTAIAGTAACAKADEPFKRPFDTAISAAGATTLDFRGYNGDVNLVADSGTSVRIHAILAARSQAALDSAKVFASREGGTVRIAEGCGGRRLLIWNFADCEINYTIHYPKGLRLTLKSDNGDIHVEGAQGAAGIVNTNGNVEVKDAANSLDLETTNGDVVVGLADGWHGNSISLRSSQGDIRLSVPASFNATLAVHKWMGDLHDEAHFTGGPVTVNLSTHFGDIRITRT